jgi:hypothetical protein
MKALKRSLIMLALVSACFDYGPTFYQPIAVDTASVEVRVLSDLPRPVRVTFWVSYSSCGAGRVLNSVAIQSPSRAEITTYLREPSMEICPGFVGFARQTLDIPLTAPGPAVITVVSGTTRVERHVLLK